MACGYFAMLQTSQKIQRQRAEQFIIGKEFGDSVI
jgi:hypothetical protein